MTSILKRIAADPVRVYARSLNWRYRQLTWRDRVLPDFIVIGAQKAGTTSLSFYLSQHPHLARAFRSEVHFFDGGLSPAVDNFAHGELWYRANFPREKQLGTHSKTYEVSPLYIFNPLAPKRIAEMLPDVKLIALLRNPTQRAISHYFHERRKGRESLTLRDALRAEEERLEGIIQAKNYKHEYFIHCSYKLRGRYHEQLRRYHQHFTAKQMLILSSEEFYEAPEACLKRIFQFVGVESDVKIKDLAPRNVAKNKQPIDPEICEDLDEYFAAHNLALYEQVGRNFRW